MRKSGNYRMKLFACLSLLVAVMLVTVDVMYFFYMRQVLQEETAETSRNMIVQLKNATETMLRDANRSLMQLSLDVKVQNFMNWDRKDPDRNIIDIIDLLRSIHSAVAYNTYFSSCYMFNTRNGNVVNVMSGRIQNINDKETFRYDNKYLSNDMELLEKARSLFQQQKPKRDFKIYNIDTAGKENIITLIKPINSSTLNPEAILVITISPQYFSDILDSIKINEKAHVFILDESGKKVSKIEDHFVSWMRKNSGKHLAQMDAGADPEANGKAGSFTGDIDGRENMISYVSSEAYGWQYVYVIPTSEIYQKIQFSFLYVTVLSLFCLVLGIGFAYVLATRLYHPIRRLVDSVRSSREGGNERVEDELGYIDESINRLIVQNKGFEELFDENMPLLKNTVLINLLRSETGLEEQVWDKLDFYGCNLRRNSAYAVCILGIDEFEAFSREYSEKQIGMLQVYQTGVIYETSREFDNLSVEVVKLGNCELGLIASLDCPDEKNAYDTLARYIIQVHKTITEHVRYTVTIGIGSLGRELGSMKISFNEARSAYGYKVIKGINEIIFISDIPEVHEWYYVHPVDIEKNIFKYLKSGEKEQVFLSLDSYFEYTRKNIADYTVIKYVYFHLLDSTLKCCLDMAININDVFPKGLNLINDLQAQKSTASMNAWVKNLFSMLIDYINAKKDNKLEDIVQGAISYIDRHYASPDISLELLSDQLHFSVSYIAKLFRDATGKSLKEYITEKRIQAAKQLLEDGGLKVKDIGEQVGYPNTQSFIKIFKKYEGVTPGEYEDQLLQRKLAASAGGVTQTQKVV